MAGRARDGGEWCRNAAPWPPVRATWRRMAAKRARFFHHRRFLAGLREEPGAYPRRVCLTQRRDLRSRGTASDVRPGPGANRVKHAPRGQCRARLVSATPAITSALDNRIDRDAYLARCWPNSAMLAGFECVDVAVHGEYVFVVYEAETSTGRRFRNAERLRVRDGRIVAAEVYFGWYVPHPAPDGGFVESGRLMRGGQPPVTPRAGTSRTIRLRRSVVRTRSARSP